MGRIRTIFALVVLAATFVAPTPAKAVRTIDIEIRDNLLSPNPLIADPGDEIRFTLKSAGRHELRTYAATSDTVIDSGVIDFRESPISFGSEFAGGTVRYRCMQSGHSAFDKENGICAGMCGTITEEDTIPMPPVIDTPTRTIQEKPATIKGTAEPLTIVTLTEGTTVSGGIYQGQAMADVNGVWEIKTVNFGNISGKKPLIARAVRAVGYVSDDSATVYYQYLRDGLQPRMTFDPTPPAFVGKITFSGTARDNVGIRGIQIRFSGLQFNPNLQNVTNITKIFTLPGVCEAPLTCPNLAAEQTLRWTFETYALPGELPAGTYQVSAIAIDMSDNKTSLYAPTFDSGRIVFVAPDLVTAPVASMIPTVVPSPVPSPVIGTTPPSISPTP